MTSPLHNRIEFCTLNDYKRHFASSDYKASNGAFGTPGLLDLAFSDSRWDGTIIAASIGETEVYIPALVARATMVRSTPLIMSFQEAGYATNGWDKVVLIGGAPGTLPGYLYHVGASTTKIVQALELAVEAAASWSDDQDAHMLVYHADTELATACMQLRERATMRESAMRAFLPVKMLADYQKHVRATYNADLRQFKRLGLSWRRVHWKEVLDEVGGMIVALKRRHGRDEVVRRLREEILDIEAGGDIEVLGIVVLNDVKQVVGGSLMWVYRDLMHVVEVGMVDDTTYKRDAYFASLVHAPLEIAQERRLTLIDLGLNAPTPKRARGAKLEPSYHVMVTK